MAGTTVALSRVYTEGSRRLDSLTFRVPRWQDFVELGEVEEWQPVDDPRSEAPRMMLIKHHDVIANYAERCLQAPATPADLVALDLADTLAVHGAIRDFFVTARPSKEPPTDSSGGSEKDSARSGG